MSSCWPQGFAGTARAARENTVPICAQQTLGSLGPAFGAERPPPGSTPACFLGMGGTSRGLTDHLETAALPDQDTEVLRGQRMRGQQEPQGAASLPMGSVWGVHSPWAQVFSRTIHTTLSTAEASPTSVALVSAQQGSLRGGEGPGEAG